MDSGTYLYDEKIKPIDSIEFSIWGNQEVKNTSALGRDSVGLNIPDLYDNMEPKKGGLIDTRLGVIENHIDCGTCGLNTNYCVGHFGHIDLAVPVFHMGYLNYVKKILSCICLRCSKLLVYKNEEDLTDMLKNKSGKTRFAEIRAIAKNVSYCQKLDYGCGTPVSKIKVDINKKTAVINIISETNLTNVPVEAGGIDGKKKIKQIITPEECYNILKNISDKDCMIMGLDPKKSRPEDMIYKIFPVPPVQVRPSAKADFMASSILVDDLTRKLTDIIKNNARIRKFKENMNESTAKYSQDNINLMQYHVATYFDNDSVSIPKSEQGGKPVKTLASRLKGKQGRIRGNLMGKRVDFSARTVITPDPTIDINQLGVPLKVAMNLTFPEVVTPNNIEHLQKLVKNGSNVYPGANFVFPVSRMTGSDRVLPIVLRYRKDKVELRYGDIVERHIVDDDFVLLNRQPTLHKLSMMGHRIKVIHDDNLATFRLNVAATTPYNADFDGDEMNIFLPQSIQTQIELEEIADVKRQIISPATSTPIIGIVQDGLLGAYNLTDPSMKIDWRDVMNIISYTTIDDFSSLKKDKQYQGKDLFSLIIPPKISTGIGGVDIKKGQLKSGQIHKAHLGSKKRNSLIHLIWDEYGIEETKNFIDNTQRLVNNYNLINGFTVGIGDISVPKDVREQLSKMIETKKLDINHLITEMENNPGLLNKDLFEESILSELNAMLGDVSKVIMNNLEPENHFGIMITSGSKGGPINMGQMSGCIAQANVEGKRIRKKFNGRSLQYFHKNDDSALSRGFIEDSFLDGLEPKAFILHNMGSREGLIDTAIKTASTGYIQRKLIKSSEDAMIKYDLTVRNANDTILQFTYGDNGIDSTKQSHVTLKMLSMGNKEVSNKFKFTNQELKNYTSFSSNDNNRYYEDLLDMRNNIRKAIMKSTMNEIILKDTFMIPVNLYRIINNISNSDDKFGGGKLTPDYVLKKLDDLLDYKNTMISCMGKEDSENENSLKYRDELTAKTLFKVSLHEYLGPKISILNHGLTKGKFDEIYKQIKEKFNKSVVEAGEMVGTIGAQSIGEPLTQLTLNSIDWNDKIILEEDGLIKTVEIGKFIDEYIENNNNLTKRLEDNKEEEMGDTYYVDVSKKNIMAISVNKDGKLSWNTVTALTKHLPMNKDGTNELVKIKTRLGREITATKAKSFLTRINNEIKPIRGDQIKIGTMIPVMVNFPDNNKILDYINLVDYFPKTEYIYGSEIEKARLIKEQVNQTGGRLWFKHNIGKKFLTPYSRQDSLKEVIDKGKEVMYKINCIYSKNGKCVSEIPEKLPLDDLFGFFVGAYLAEGLVTKTYVCISNNDKKFRQKIINFCNKYKIGYHLQVQENKIQQGWTSIDVRIHSVMLAKLMKKIFDTGSANKGLPQWVYNANKEFIKNLIDGYFSGDGTVSYKRNQIVVASASEKLIDGMILLLTRFNIMAKKGKTVQIKKNNRGSKNIKPSYPLSIRNGNINKFYKQIGLLINDKHNKLKKINNYDFKYENGVYDKIPGNNLESIKGTIHKNIVKDLINSDINDNDKIILKKIIDSDVYYDEIISIELVKPTNKYVYDLTVDKDKTFVSYSGIVCYDTFHSAGIGAKGTNTLGVPRMNELLSFSKNMKTPQMIIYLEEKLRSNTMIANKIASSVKYTILKDLIKSVNIYYNPDPNKKDSFMDRDNTSNIFHSYKPSKYSCQSDITNLPWLMRIELDRETLMDKDINLLDIKSKFCNFWEKRFNDTKGMKKDEKQILEKITQCAIISNNINDRIPIIHIRFDMIDFNLSTITGFLEKFIEPFKLKGIDPIKGLEVTDENLVNFDNDDQELNKKKQHLIYTKGVNLKKIRYINGIDLNNIRCNDIVVIYHTFGIEAARAALIHELNEVFEGGGTTVNYQHLSILIDIMTNNGRLTSIDRHGLNNLDTDPLARASFEKTVDQLIAAAVFGEVDKMRSVSSRIMAGLVVNGGTGLCDLILDTNMLQNSEYVEELEQKYEQTFNELSIDTVVDDVMKKGETDDIFIPV
jgi:DNA-directed RNA polymerase II subunit RPB1